MQNNLVLVSVIVNILVVILPLFGVHVGSEQLTETAQTLATVVTGLVIHFQHKKAVDIAAGKRAD